MTYAVLNGPQGQLVDVPVDRVEIARDGVGVRLVDEERGISVFVPLVGSSPFLFEHERREPYPKDGSMSLDEVRRRIRDARG